MKVLTLLDKLNLMHLDREARALRWRAVAFAMLMNVFLMFSSMTLQWNPFGLSDDAWRSGLSVLIGLMALGAAERRASMIAMGCIFPIFFAVIFAGTPAFRELLVNNPVAHYVMYVFVVAFIPLATAYAFFSPPAPAPQQPATA